MPVDHFDLIARCYDRAAEFPLSSEFLELLDISPQSRLLDVGGGAGRVAAPLARQAASVVIVDPSQAMLQYARGKGLLAVRASAEALPFGSAGFDRLIMVDVLHHVRDQQAAVDEFWRILPPGGKVLIMEPDIRKYSMKLIALAEKLLLMRSHFLSCERIQGLFQGKGAEITIRSSGVDVLLLAKKVREM